MAGLVRKIGVVGFVLSVGVACTQLFGDERNTLAPIAAPGLPTTAPMYQQPGAPGAQACTSGEMRCVGALLQTCSDDGASWVTLQRCAAAVLCQPNPATCLTATCGASEMTCQGSILQKCNEDRTGWELFATCLSPAHCNADLRQCMPEPCNPGDRRCDRSEADQSPVLEVCNDARLDWAPLDACVTRELCDQTLTTALAGTLAIGSDGMVQLAAPLSPSSVEKCALPACNGGEVRCDGTRLEVCAEGRTGWTLVEECASDALCSGSLTNVNASGAPQCLPPACAVGQHQCTVEGVLQVCSEDRAGFRTIQACIGPPFCNAVLADQGEEGCRSAPCEGGEMQCNGAQIQVCMQDRTALDDTGPPCESAALCNAEDPFNAFCEEPTCRRGATSGNEFHCDGAQLQRCNEGLTGYDTVQTCVTAALCDASQRLNGCRPPVCRPGQHTCTDAGLLRTCNADQTGHTDTENCGSRGQCDANAGRCADPCEAGRVRCAQDGDLEECRDLLTGWQTIGECASQQLCDANNRRCNPPVCQLGDRHCETRNGNPVIVECASGRDAFVVARTCRANEICDSQNNECDICAPNTSTCDGDTLVRCDARGQTQARQTPACGPGLCSAAKGRCLVCNPINSARCVDLQLRVCASGNNGDEFERSENCDTPQLCTQTLNSCGRGLNGQSCQCNDGACAPNQLRCQNGTIQRCNAGLTGFDTTQTCQFGCNQGSTVCNECSGTTGQCNGTQFRACNNGRLANAINCTDTNPCTNVACNPQSGCQFPAVANNTSCSDGNACNGNETCQGGNCNRSGGAVNCIDNNPCTVDNNNNCSPQTGQCSFPPVNNGTQCADNDLCDGTETCNNGVCSATGTRVTCNAPGDPCRTNTCSPQTGACAQGNAPNNTPCPGGTCQGGTCRQTCTTGTCNGTQFTACNNGQPAAVRTCPDDANNPCTSPSCNPQNGCGLQNVTGSCTINGAAGTCQAGTCRPNGCQSNAECADPDSCTTDVCDVPTGVCQHIVITGCVVCTPGPVCDGTTPATCNAAGNRLAPLAVCRGAVRNTCPVANGPVQSQTCPSDGNACTNDCAADGCRFVPHSDPNTPCDVNNGPGRCVEGVCLPRCQSDVDCPFNSRCDLSIPFPGACRAGVIQ